MTSLELMDDAEGDPADWDGLLAAFLLGLVQAMQEAVDEGDDAV